MDLDNKKILYLSAHHDDMVYSSAITVRHLIDRGCQITNLNLFTVSGWHITNNTLSIAEVSAMRLQEERRMSTLMGFVTLSAGLPDSFTRGLDSEQELNQCCDAEQAEAFSAVLRQYVDAAAYDLIFVPLSGGNHIDHKYTRYLAEKTCGVSTLVYYEDMPYIKPGADIYHLIPEGSTPVCFVGNYEAKLADMRVYSSQMEEKNMDRIKQYGKSLLKGHYAERIWVVNGSNDEISY